MCIRDRQRVAIGRAIVREPAVFLFDEPLSNLDAKLRVETRTELLRLQRQLGITSLYVTHDQEEAMTLSDRIVVMRDGQVAQAGPPEEVYSRPADTFVATFVGSPKMNLIDGAVSGGELRTESGIRIAVSAPDTAAVTIGIRPDDLILTPVAGGAARVELVELLGPRAIVTVGTAGQRLTSVVESGQLSDITPGATVQFSARDVHRFDVKTGARLSG